MEARGPHGGPGGEAVACPACGKSVDVLRAGHVAIFGDRFYFFCDRDCREEFLAQPHDDKHARLDATEATIGTARELVDRTPTPDNVADEELTGELSEEEILGAELPSQSPSDLGTLLLLSATVAGVLSVALALIGNSATVLIIRMLLGAMGAGLLVARATVIKRNALDAHAAVLLAPSIASVVVAAGALMGRVHAAQDATVLMGLIVISTGISIHLAEQMRLHTQAELANLVDALTGSARKVVPSGYSIVSASGLRPGEEIVVNAGEMVPVDVMISAGQATVLPWRGARTATRKEPGEPLVAGSQLVSGRVRGTVTWAGNDRAWLRTIAEPARAAHLLGSVPRLGRMLVERWALAGAALVGLASFVNRGSTVSVLIASIAGYSAVVSATTAAAPAYHILRETLAALGRGIAYFDADAWERASHTTIMVFCARGSLLLGEPHVAEIIGLGETGSERLVALSAGAQATMNDPISDAIQKAARTRGIEPDAVRNRSVVSGLGVTALTSNGETMCVGSRALMLRHHISMALAETKLAELEAIGRTVLMVAVAGKLIGFIGLQDGLQSGARGAVQHLLDAGLEPVFLSGDARETCETIARSLDIEHVRPEILPADKAQEIRNIAESGATVAVVGRPGVDDSALSSAEVSVALGAAGGSFGEFAITLAGSDVRDAVRAIVWARRSRIVARQALLIGVAPGFMAMLAIAFGLLPPAYAPLGALVGSIGAFLHAKAAAPEDAR